METPIAGELPEAEPGSDRDIAARVEEHLLGGPRRFRRNQVAAVSDVDLVYVRRLWRAMGFTNVGDDAVAFTEGDVLALDQLLHLVKDEVVDKDLLSVSPAPWATRWRAWCSGRSRPSPSI